MINRREFLGLGAVPLVAGAACGHESPGIRGALATVHPLATDAAVRAMQDGGNAVDGAIAAALMLGVVDGHNSGIGGGLFMLVRRPDGAIMALDGREVAPRAATRDMFLRNGRADPELSQHGPLAVAVPTALAALDHAARKCGRLPLSRPLETAASIAETGFVPDRVYNSRLSATAEHVRRFPATANVFLRPQEDGRLRLPDLAASYRAIAAGGIDWFYRGRFSELTAAWMKEHGGILDAADFDAYRPKEREPIRTVFRDHEIVGFPPPSSGGVHVAQILNILSEFDLGACGDLSVDFIHLVTEAMKLAFADRAHWLGDADFVVVPRGLVSAEYAATLAARIDRSRAGDVPRHGEPPDAQTNTFRGHTTHFSAADAEGCWVACTATINTAFGSKVVIPGTGIVLNNQMDDFAAQPGVPNSFGLVGAEANAVGPGKRPLSSMSPTFVLKAGRPVLSVGAAGGPTIISQVVLAILRAIEFRCPLAETLARARFHHQWQPDELRIERDVPEAVRRGLENRGHRLDAVGSLGAAQAVASSDAGQFSAAHDPRVPGAGAVW